MAIKLQIDATKSRKQPQSLLQAQCRYSRHGKERVQLWGLMARLKSCWSRARSHGRAGGSLPTAPRGSYYRKLALITLGMVLAYWSCSSYLQLYLDQQPVTSIQNSRWYLVTKWQPYPQDTGELRAYREFMHPLVTAQQLQVAAYVRDDARKDQSHYLSEQLERLRTQWQDYVVAEPILQAESSESYVSPVRSSPQAVPAPSLTSAPHHGLLTLVSVVENPQTINRVETAQGSLIPTDQYSLPRGAARDLPFQLYVLRNEQLISAFPAQQRFVKYVVGYRGDVVLIFPHAIYVNNVWIRPTPAPVAQQLRLHSVLDPLQRAYRVIQLQAGQYWVMGDAPESIDSAYFGPVAREQFEGKVAWHF